MGPCSVSVASQNNTYYTCLNIVNFIDPIPACAGMTKGKRRDDKGVGKDGDKVPLRRRGVPPSAGRGVTQ